MIRIDPVDHGLVVDREDAPDAAEVRAFEVEAHGLALGLVGVAERLRVRRVDALTLPALVALAASLGVAGFSLQLC